MKGILWHVFRTAFSSYPSALSQDSSLAKTNETQALMSHCNDSLRDKAIRGGFVRIQRESTLQGVNHCQGMARFCEGGGIHMLMSGRIIPTIGEPPTPPSFDTATSGCVCWLIDWGLST